MFFVYILHLRLKRILLWKFSSHLYCWQESVIFCAMISIESNHFTCRHLIINYLYSPGFTLSGNAYRDHGMLHIILGVVFTLVVLLVFIIICIFHQRRKSRQQKDKKDIEVRYVTRAPALDRAGSACSDRLLKEKTEKVSIVWRLMHGHFLYPRNRENKKPVLDAMVIFSFDWSERRQRGKLSYRTDEREIWMKIVHDRFSKVHVPKIRAVRLMKGYRNSFKMERTVQIVHKNLRCDLLDWRFLVLLKKIRFLVARRGIFAYPWTWSLAVFACKSNVVGRFPKSLTEFCWKDGSLVRRTWIRSVVFGWNDDIRLSRQFD